MIHKEFLLAFIEGKVVEARHADLPPQVWFEINDENCIGIFKRPNVEFRIKPRVITLERWAVVYERCDGSVDSSLSTTEAGSKNYAESLRKDGYKVLFDAAPLRTELEVNA